MIQKLYRSGFVIKYVKRKSSIRDSGFTLIEAVVVIGIIGILMTLVVHTARKMRLKSMIEATRAQIQKYSNALEVFYSKHHEYPPSEGTKDIPCKGSECLFEFLCKAYKYKSECDPADPTLCNEKVDDPIIPPSALLSWEFEGRKKPKDYSKPNKIIDIFGTELRFFSPGKAREDKYGPAETPDIYSCGIIEGRMREAECESDNGKCTGNDICSWALKSIRK